MSFLANSLLGNFLEPFFKTTPLEGVPLASQSGIVILDPRCGPAQQFVLRPMVALTLYAAVKRPATFRTLALRRQTAVQAEMAHTRGFLNQSG